MRVEQKKQKKKRKWLRNTGIILLILLIGIGAYAFSVYRSLTTAVETMHQPLERNKSDKRTEQVSLESKQPFSVLMLGVDQRSGDKGRSDTMIVLAVNPNLNSVKMISIPRDTRTEIIGKGKIDKINHAYAYGNEEMAMKTVENFLDIPIDYFVRVNMDGFKEIIDAVGGITVNNDLDFSQDGYHFPKGPVNLDGNKALAYIQMRYEDPRGDFGRQLRQREIIQGILSEGASLSSLTKYQSIFSALGNNVRTNLTFDQMNKIQRNYRSAAGNVQQMSIKGSGTKISGIYYYIVPDDEKARIQTDIKAQLELK
ncbi:membrane-bound transcriptional regulator LytR [Neobacillus bataviensis LMG 21833]|uniref:Polyisoprenyl-teichoic acid--peptidoglycan teichoic acid transferase TagU n=1 Tax=Neobacillus bataviensis LMG 21833 TaxID=1117379 RepID=K6DFJ5_9BACI|nr:LytR family transcriptional regulator [Neobacillus bataviensis]EKN71327.1 membrane-bound transcriptional regulator LytR [Neobacillus bataviensis LMG 21833]